jgi:hypothetical protein
MGLGVWLLAGCFYLPGSAKLVEGKDASRDVGSSKSDRPVRTGSATRADAFRVLGEPQYASADGRRVAYEWVITKGRWVYPLCFGSTANHETRTLILTFDDADKLAAYQLTRWGQNWMTAGNPPPPPNLPQEVHRPYRPLTPQTRP